jgi:hypothetical protein
MHSTHCACQKRDSHTKEVTPGALTETWQRGKDDEIIRNFVELLYPSLGDYPLDLLISGKRSLTNAYSPLYWKFAVVPSPPLMLPGFTSSGTPCGDSDFCSVKLDASEPLLIGMLYQRRSRVIAYIGQRPEVSQKSFVLQRSMKVGDSLTDIEAIMLTAGVRYAPSSESALRKYLQAHALFLKYGFRIDRLQFCRTVTTNPKQPAMYWQALVFSKRWRRSIIVAIEPFEGDITSMIVVNKEEKLAMTCEK